MYFADHPLAVLHRELNHHIHNPPHHRVNVPPRQPLAPRTLSYQRRWALGVAFSSLEFGFLTAAARAPPSRECTKITVKTLEPKLGSALVAAGMSAIFVAFVVG
jgi:hypothetical protein